MEDIKREFIICLGVPGAGKTTFAKEWVAKDPENRFRFNNDEALKMLTDGVFTRDAYQVVKDMQAGFIKGVAIGGKSAVVDNTHMNPSVLRWWLTYLDMEIDNYTTKKYDIIVKDFTSVPLDVCLKRNSERENPIQEIAITKMYNNIKEVKEVLNEFVEFGNVKVERYDI